MANQKVFRKKRNSKMFIKSNSIIALYQFKIRDIDDYLFVKT